MRPPTPVDTKARPRNRLPPSLLLPRHWPLWAALGLLWLLSRLPLRVQTRVTGALGGLMYRVLGRRRHIAEVNIRLCFPELDAGERQRLVRAHFRSLGMMVIETGLSWWGSDQRLKPLATVHGLQHLEQALAQGRGVLLLSAHFTTLEIGGHLLAAHVPHAICGMYRRHENPVIEYLMTRGRESFFEKMIPRDDVRTLLRSLKDNKIIWYAPDQAHRGKNSVLAPFFGIPAATNPATSRIAQMSGAAIVPFFPVRRPDGLGYELWLDPALNDFPAGDPLKDATRVNQLIERQVLRSREQYYWIHRRFKRRDGADVYA